ILTTHLDKLRSAGLKYLLPQPNDFKVGVDKWKLSQFLHTKGVPHPFTMPVDVATTETLSERLTFPVIIKPDNAGNGMGIHSFQTREQFKYFFDHSANKRYHYLVQPLIPGYDIDCSVLCKDGKVLAYTIQKGIMSPKQQFRAAIGIEFLHNDEVIAVV